MASRCRRATPTALARGSHHEPPPAAEDACRLAAPQLLLAPTTGHERKDRAAALQQPEARQSLLKMVSDSTAAPCSHWRSLSATMRTLRSRSGCLRSGAPPLTAERPLLRQEHQENLQLNLKATSAPLLRHLRPATPAEMARDRAGKGRLSQVTVHSERGEGEWKLSEILHIYLVIPRSGLLTDCVTQERPK
jgi:hypothetical protein